MRAVARGGGRRGIVERKYYEDSRRLSLYWPAEHVSLWEVSGGRLSIRLHSGDLHEFDEGEAREMLAIVPKYLWRLVKVPLMLRYVREESGVARYHVMGDVWQRRLVELLLRSRLSSEGVESLDLREFRGLVSKYRSMIFVSISR